MRLVLDPKISSSAITIDIHLLDPGDRSMTRRPQLPKTSGRSRLGAPQFLAANLEVPGRSVRLSALGLRRDPHGSVKQIHREELEDGD
jgi:hypothetical protein